MKLGRPQIEVTDVHFQLGERVFETPDEVAAPPRVAPPDVMRLVRGQTQAIQLLTEEVRAYHRDLVLWQQSRWAYRLPRWIAGLWARLRRH